MSKHVAMLISLSSFVLPTLSMDDDYPEELVWVATGWFSTAIMVWREYELPETVA